MFVSHWQDTTPWHCLHSHSDDDDDHHHHRRRRSAFIVAPTSGNCYPHFPALCMRPSSLQIAWGSGESDCRQPRFKDDQSDVNPKVFRWTNIWIIFSNLPSTDLPGCAWTPEPAVVSFLIRLHEVENSGQTASRSPLPTAKSCAVPYQQCR